METIVCTYGDNCLHRWALETLVCTDGHLHNWVLALPVHSHPTVRPHFPLTFSPKIASDTGLKSRLLRPGGFFWKIQNCPPPKNCHPLQRIVPLLQRIVPLLQGFLPRLFSSTSGCIAWGHLSCTEKTFHKLLHPSCLRAFSQAASFSSFLSFYCFLLSDVQGQKVSHICKEAFAFAFAKKHSSINHLTAHCCFWPSIRGLLAHIFIHILII